MFSGVDRIPACDGVTDGQTSCHGIVCAMHTRRVVKKVKVANLLKYVLAYANGKHIGG